MDNEPVLHSLISLADFKAILGFDERAGALSRYCLITAVYHRTILQTAAFATEKHRLPDLYRRTYLYPSGISGVKGVDHLYRYRRIGTTRRTPL
jgi:hypothetical protein